MFFGLFHTNDQGLTFIEVLIGLISISIVALALQGFISSNFRTNDHIINETDNLVAANKLFSGITDELKYGSGFISSNGGRTLRFTTDVFNAAGQEVMATISWDGSNITLIRDDSSLRTLNAPRDRIENLIFETPNKYNVLIKLTIDSKTYETIIRGLNEYDK